MVTSIIVEDDNDNAWITIKTHIHTGTTSNILRESLLVDNNCYTEQVATSTDDDKESKQSSGDGVQLQPYQSYHSTFANTNNYDDIKPELYHRKYHHEDGQNYTEHLYSLKKLSISYQTHIDYDNIGNLITLSLSHTFVLLLPMSTFMSIHVSYYLVLNVFIVIILLSLTNIHIL